MELRLWKISAEARLPAIFALAAILVSLPVPAASPEAITEHESPIVQLFCGAWDNPSLTVEQYRQSLSRLSAGYSRGDETRFCEFCADTYMHTPAGTITGNASYRNGKRLNVTACLNDDPEIVYPYLTCADTGGDMNFESYCFGGSWAGAAGRFCLGVSGAYDAALSYRSVDPRPRNVTGNLRLSAGCALRVARAYLLGAAVQYIRYTQSSETSFKSEMGEEPVFHLTGLGNVYNRFTGLGKSTTYGGNTFKASLSLLPSSRGFYAHMSSAVFRMNHLLADLNKLPMARVDDRRIEAAGGFRSGTWAVVASVSAKERHGYENIFGDAVAGQYPLIGSLGMYSHTALSAALAGSARLHVRHTVLWLTPRMAWWRSTERYRQHEAVRSTHAAVPGLGVKSVSQLPHGTVMTLSAEWQHITGPRDGGRNLARASVELLWPLKTRFYPGLQASFTHEYNINTLSVSALLKF